MIDMVNGSFCQKGSCRSHFPIIFSLFNQKISYSPVYDLQYLSRNRYLILIAFRHSYQLRNWNKVKFCVVLKLQLLEKELMNWINWLGLNLPIILPIISSPRLRQCFARKQNVLICLLKQSLPRRAVHWCLRRWYWHWISI